MVSTIELLEMMSGSPTGRSAVGVYYLGEKVSFLDEKSCLKTTKKHKNCMEKEHFGVRGAIPPY